MNTRRIAWLLPLLLFAAPLWAVIATYQFSDPALETRYRQLSAELRCPKCQNQTIADSNAPIAQDLRGLLYQQLEAGATDEEILEYMVARYGEFVRYRPRFGGATAALWLAPGLLLIGGIAIALAILRRRRELPGAAAPALTAAEQDRLQQLLTASERDS